MPVLMHAACAREECAAMKETGSLRTNVLSNPFKEATQCGHYDDPIRICSHEAVPRLKY